MLSRASFMSAEVVGKRVTETFVKDYIMEGVWK